MLEPVSSPVATNKYWQHAEDGMSNAKEGWICPKCGLVNAPWMPNCSCTPSRATIPYEQSWTSHKKQKPPRQEMG